MGKNSVFFLPNHACFEDNPPGTVVFGNPGKGKTYFALLNSVNSILCDIDLIYIDPKNDASAIQQFCPDLNVVDVANVRKGSLNPFKIIKNVDTQLLLSLISCFYGDIPPDVKTALIPILQDFVVEVKRHGDNPEEVTTMNDLIDWLYRNEDEKVSSVGGVLMGFREGTGQLIFGDDLSDNSSSSCFETMGLKTVISLMGLPIPEQGKNVRDDMKITVAVLYLLCVMIMERIKAKPKEKPLLVVIDEVHILLGNEMVSTIIEQLLSLGRSLNTAVVLLTQYPIKLSPQNVSNKFLFQTTKEGAKDFFDIYDQTKGSPKEINRDNLTTYATQLKQGQCIYIDSYDRAGVVQINHSLDISSNPLQEKGKEA